MTSILQFEEFIEEKGKGLWANVHAKKASGEKPAKKGDDDYPDQKAYKSASESQDPITESTSQELSKRAQDARISLKKLQDGLRKLQSNPKKDSTKIRIQQLRIKKQGLRIEAIKIDQQILQLKK